MKNRRITPYALAAASLLLAGAAQAVSLPATGYTQGFDSMGTGTAPPTDWTLWNGAAGTANNTWTAASGITANGAAGSVASMVASTAALTVATGPTANANNGYNAALASATGDRILGTAPTTISGTALQLSLSNDTGFAFNALNVAYDTVRFTAAGTANELPGYQLFFSLGGNSWTNVASFNPTLTTVPNTTGVSPFAGQVSLGALVAPGATILLRWVDDNATQSSPDQVIGLNNVSISAVPEPGTVGLLLAGLAVLAWLAQRNGRRS